MIHNHADTSVYTSADFRFMTRPCVYLFLKDGKALYVGSSGTGMMRIASPTHHRRRARDMADEIRVLWFRKTHVARGVEKDLIKELDPPFNTHGKRDKRIML